MENRSICAQPASSAHCPLAPRGAERPASRRAAGLAVLLLLLATSGQVLGQDSVTLAGRVVDSLRAGIPYATLGAYTSDSALLGGTVCNESGHFRVALAQQPSYLMVRALGYTTARIALGQPYDSLFVLAHSSQAIEAVEVSAKRPQIAMHGGGLEMAVKGSLLQYKQDIWDVLSNVPGLIRDPDGGVKLVSGAKPVFYLNGRPVRSNQELEAIDLKNIEYVRLNTSPGTRYGAQVQAVVEIKTTSLLEGLSLFASTWGKVPRDYSHYHRLNAQYRFGGTSLFAGCSGGNEHYYQQFTNHAQFFKGGQLALEQHTDFVPVHDDSYALDYFAGLDQQLGKQWSAGVKYDGGYEWGHDTSTNTTRMVFYPATGDTTLTKAASRLYEPAYGHHVNGYLDWNNQQGRHFSFNVDYYLRARRRQQTVREQTDPAPVTEVHHDNSSRNQMVSLMPSMEWTLGPHQVELGGEYSWVEALSAQGVDGQINSDYLNLEQTFAAFTNYGVQLGGWNLQAGLRFEYTLARMRDDARPQDSKSVRYPNWLATASASTQWGHTNHTLSFRSWVKRPGFQYLSNYSYYVNSYTRQTGNPALRPSTVYQLQYNLMWQFLYVQLQYKATAMPVLIILTPVDATLGQVLAKPQNAPWSHSFTGFVNLRYQWGFYRPTLTVGCFYEYTQWADENIIKPKPFAFLETEHSFSIPGNFTLTLGYSFQSQATAQLGEADPKHNLTASLSWKGLGDQLEVSLNGNDLLDRARDNFHMRFTGMNYWQRNNYYRRNFSFTVRWRFHQHKEHYRGSDAAKDLIDRL